MPLLTLSSTRADREALAELNTRPRPAVGLYTVAVVTIVLVVLFIWSLAVNPAIDWSDVATYFFNPRIMQGLVVTLQITALSLLVGFSSGLLIAVMRLSNSKILRSIAVVWVWFFRAVPVLVLLILINNVALLYPELGIGVPGFPMIVGVETTSVMTPFLAAIVAFGANEGAYASEVFRASIKSVPRGQVEASHALGMPPLLTYRRVILPQAMRVAVPPLSNNAINMLKGTSLVSYIGVSDLLYTTQSIYAQNYKVIALLIVACLWYLILVSVLTFAQSKIENRLGFDRKRRGVLAKEVLSHG